MNKGTSDVDSNSDKPPLPTGWFWVTLRDIAQISGGITKGKKRRYSEKVRMVPYLRVANVQRGYFDLSEVKEIEATESEIEALRLQPGDILFNEGGDRDKLGRGWVWNGELDECVHQNHVFRARVLDSDISPKFISFYANSEGQRYFMEHATQTTNLASINLTKLGALPIPLPPAEEQRRIVEEIEKQLTRLDAGASALRRIQAKLKRYRSSVLKAACEGRLVPNEVQLAKVENRSVETGEALLARILTKRRENWQGRGKYKEPVAPDIANLPSLPNGWTWATAEQISDENRPITYGVIKLGAHVADGVHILRSSDVRHLRLDLQNVKRVSPAIAESYRRTFLKGGEVLITIRGTLGGVVVSPSECAGFNISREVAMLAMIEPEIAKAIAIFIGSPLAQRWMMQRAKGIAYTGINIETLKQTPVPLPSLTEQARIVAEVERRLSVVENLQVIVTDNLQRAARMRQAVLRLAFAGQLVAQDQSDKPVSLNLRAKESPPLPISAQRITSRKRTKAMSNKPAATLIGLLECLDSLGGSSAPERLFMALKFDNDVEAFFDLLRQGKNEGALNVPFGNSSIIRRAGHAS